MKSIDDLLRRADSLMAEEKYDEAEPYLLTAIKHHPKNADALLLLGEVLCKQTRFDESIAVLQKADRLRPNHTDTLHLLGWALFMGGNGDQGCAYMLQALAKRPNDFRLLCDLAVAEMRERDFLQAKEHILKAMQIAPEDDMVQEVHMVVMGMSRLQQEAVREN